MESPKLYKPRQAAEFLEVSTSKMYQMMRAGEIPVVAISNRCLRVPADALKSWLERKTRSEGW